MLSETTIKCTHFAGFLVRNLAPIRTISTTEASHLNQRWRKQRGLSVNPNTYGVLTDGPDYTFLDGKPTPYGVHQRQRILKQREIADKIITLTGEIDFAVDRHKKMLEEEDNRRQQILDNKLKPKGIELLKKN